MKIYISSTIDDLRDYRRAAKLVVRRAGYDFLAQEEDYTAEDEEPETKCVDDVRQCDGYIGLVAWKHGRVTELEYNAARDANIPRLLFLLDESYPWPPGQIDKDRAKVEKLRTRLCDDRLVDFFKTVDDFQMKLATALMRIRSSTRGNSSLSKIPGEELRDYRNWAMSRYGELELLGILDVGFLFTLSDLYVPLRLSLRNPLETFEHSSGEEIPARSRDIAIENVFSIVENSDLVILGDPGSGKTTLLRETACRVLTRGGRSLGLQDDIVPVYVPLRHCAKHQLSLSVESWIADEFERHGPSTVTQALAISLWRRGNVLLLLDGLDEIANDNRRRDVCRCIENDLAAARSRGVRCIVTSRYAGYEGETRLRSAYSCIELRPLDATSVERFVLAWFERAKQTLHLWQDTSSYDRLAETLLGALTSAEPVNRRLQLTASNPLMLTLLCILVMRTGEIPHYRAEFYRECLRMLLGGWSRAKGFAPIVPIEDALSILRHVGFYLHVASRRDDLEGEEFSRIATPMLKGMDCAPGLSAEQLLRWLNRGAGILAEYSIGRFGFAHLAFQEFLSAQHIARERGRLLQDLAVNATDDWWREVVLILLGLPEYTVFEEFMDAALLPNRLLDDPDFLRKCVDQAFRPKTEPFERVLDNFSRSSSEKAAALRVFVNRDEPAIAAAAQALRDSQSPDLSALARQVFKETRVTNESSAIPTRIPQVSHSDLDEKSEFVETHTGITFLPIPKGEFEMGCELFPDAMPRFVAHIRHFFIAQTPVTNGQYAMFLAATDHVEPAFWREPRFADSDQPVVGVNWNDSISFCRWLSSVCGLVCDLPTEAQWEYCARGLDGREYPWGNSKPDTSKACYGESGLDGRPAVVGSYPAGRGPFGTLDQAGNVWEWCRDIWDSDAYASWAAQAPVEDPVQLSGHAAVRVLRGGNWWYTTEGLHAAYRFRNPASNCNDDIGFRPVLLLG